MAKTTHIFLTDPDLVRRLEEQAKAEHRSKIAVIRRALERYLAEADTLLRYGGRTMTPAYHEIVDALCGLRNIPVPPAPPLGAIPQPAVGQNTGEFSFLAPPSVAGRESGCGEEGER